jgi:hypothetical protein
MGLEHVALGRTGVNTIDLGTSMARVNGQTTLRIAFLPMGGNVAAFSPKAGNPVSVQPYEENS